MVRARWLAWSLFALGAAWVLVGSAMLVVQIVDGTMSIIAALQSWTLLPPAAAFSIVGLVVALRQPRNACGWLMLVIGTIWSLGVAPQPARDSVFNWATSWGWVPPFGLMATHLPLRLPDGRLPSPRWRWVSRLATIAMVTTSVGLLFDPETPANPLANRSLALIGLAGLILLALCAVLSVSSLFVRSRTADADERHQIRWIAIGALVFVSSWILSFFAQPFVGSSAAADALVSGVTLLFYTAIPISIGIAVLRYRLYDIDIVIRKALVVAVLGAFFVAVYALVVGGVGAFVESSSNTTLSFAAAAIVALLSQPVLARARPFADRVVYGKRATPYEVLAEFGEHLAGTYAADEVLPRTARLLAEGVGADRARVWLSNGDELRAVTTWPPDADPAREDDYRADVRHRGELLGALSVAMPASDPMDPAKEKLIGDVAAQAGLVLRNVRLLEDLRGSRRRLVSAQDEERRRLERDIHDGAQQQLVALAVKSRLARELTERDPRKAADLLAQIEAETHQALEDLRDLARGIYPPLLADEGLAAALRAQARRSPIPVEIVPDGVGRYSQPVEAAVYFSVLEALQNVAKYAEASRADVRLEHAGRALRFEVRDDGRGFDPASSRYGTGLQGIADRLAALNGTFRVASSAGAGTTVVGEIPLEGEG